MVEFARSESVFKEMKEWEWLKVKDELQSFISGTPDDVFQISAELFEGDLTPEWVELLRGEAQRNFDLLLHGGLDKTVKHPEKTVVFLLEKIGAVLAGPERKINIHAMVDKPLSRLATLFKFRTLIVLRDEGIDKITDCPECGRVFLRSRKRRYCSKLCTDRVARRVWLKDPKNRAKDAQSAHGRYERRVREKNGVKVRVDRRPRTNRKGDVRGKGKKEK